MPNIHELTAETLQELYNLEVQKTKVLTGYSNSLVTGCKELATQLDEALLKLNKKVK
jgi:hypothetical protein